jgi:hypothetical protein
MKPRIATRLTILIPLTLVAVCVSGLATGLGYNLVETLAGIATVLLLLGVLVVGVLRLLERRQLQQTDLRLGQILGAVALLVLFVLAVGVVFFLSCAANFRP